jgi:hypothetical protein
MLLQEIGGDWLRVLMFIRIMFWRIPLESYFVGEVDDQILIDVAIGIDEEDVVAAVPDAEDVL